MIFNDYVTVAKQVQNIESDYALCKLLSIKTPSFIALKKGKSLPKPTTILRLAQLANIPAEQALIDLNLWLSADNPEALKVYEKLKKLIIDVSLKSSINLILLCFCVSQLAISNLYYV